MKKILLPAPKGFQASGICCGIKPRKKDLGLIYSEVPATAAGTFTTNQLKAASVKLSKEIVSNGIIQAIIVNSGNANALTGEQGDKDALEMARTTAQELCIDISKVAVCSTGPIGKPMPMKIVREGIEKITTKLNPNGLSEAMQAILTTDTYPKYISKEFNLGTSKVTITGMAKGAGMIHPKMATMLCFIVTDLKISQKVLQEILSESVNKSFNCITVDACTSTNDSVIVMANGMAENKIIDTRNDDYNKTRDIFIEITKELAKMIAQDGEGATKLIEIEVTGASSFEDARNIGFAIANYDLLKCSFFGEVLNIGRIMAAIGAGNTKINLEKINLLLNDSTVLLNGNICQYDKESISKLLQQKKINLTVELNQGEEKAVIWTCDLSTNYVKINMD
jgi:glutamate N-acetyltransferase/amino-acid N-acetyltransferase